MNNANATSQTIDILLNHTSVRSFTSEPVSEEAVQTIFKCAQAASTSCFLQVTSVIRITDKALKAQIAKLAGGQKHVEEAPELWIFCPDYHRLKVVCPSSELGWSEQLLVGIQDAGIMGQNVFAALESLGLGGCYIGGIRNGIREVDALLKLPDHVFPLFGIAFGHPAKRNEVKPRLPASVTFMENEYHEPSEEQISAYDQIIRDYYALRSANAKHSDWSGAVASYMLKERRPFILKFLQEKGWGNR